MSHFYITCPELRVAAVLRVQLQRRGAAARRSRRVGADEIDRLWLRRNVAGPQRERWFHAAGCRRFVTLTRDTRTNIILAQPGEPAGDVQTHA